MAASNSRIWTIKDVADHSVGMLQSILEANFLKTIFVSILISTPEGEAPGIERSSSPAAMERSGIAVRVQRLVMR